MTATPTAPDTTAPPALEISDLVFGWRRQQPILDIPAFRVDAGERVFLEGPSGSGKSTLLGLVAGVTTPDRGRLEVLGESLTGLSAAARDRFRADRLGIIFQLFNLIPYLSVTENVVLPCRFSAARAQRAKEEAGSTTEAARALLDRLGLGELARRGRAVGSLSVGQQQRVAAARALIGSPGFVIADEPTSALDPHAQDVFLDTVLAEADRSGAALLFVSHNPALADRFHRRIALADINRAAPEELAA
jgi:putative ABC transport system ATP-binding protein